MNTQSRRHFIKTTLAGSSFCLASPLFAAETPATAAARSASDLVTVGKTGIKTTFLAQGTGFNGGARSSEHTRMGKEAFSKLLRHSVDQGVRFLDMADLYGSHTYVRDTLKDMKSEKFVYLSKVWPRKEDWVTPSGNCFEEVERFSKEIGVDTVDICLLHCMTNDKWPQEYASMCEGLSKLKQKGAVRAVGVSCHDLGALRVAASHPWVDVIFARINNKGGNAYAMDGSVEEVAPVLKTARANGKFIVGMKLFGAGKLVKPEEKDASLRYVLGSRLVDAITVGMLKDSEIDDTVTRVNAAFKSSRA